MSAEDERPDRGSLAHSAVPELFGRFLIEKLFELDGVSHELSLLPSGHKCSRNHGHNYVITLTLDAQRLDQYGFVTDFGDLGPFRDYLAAAFDHRRLNDVVSFHPTSELLAFHLGLWFIENVEPTINGRLVSVRVAETRGSSATWERGERA